MRTKHLCFTVLLFAILCSTPAAAQDPVTLTNGEWPPMFSQEFKFGGVGSRICKEAFALSGVEVNYIYMPWKRGLEEARIGKWDGTVGWRKSPAREPDFLFSDPILQVNTVFFHRSGKMFDWNTVDDVGHLTIGVTLGYGYIELLKDAANRGGGKLEAARSDELNLQKLAAGRIDVFPCAEQVGYYLLRTKFIPGTADLVRHHTKPLMDSQLHLLISKKNPNAQDLIDRFNRGLRTLRESGKYDQYLNESLTGEYLPEER